MKTKILAILAIAFIIAYGCSSGSKSDSASQSMEEKSKSEMMMAEGKSTAAMEQGVMMDSLQTSSNKMDETDKAANDPGLPVKPNISITDSALKAFNLSQRKIIKTAELRFKVKSVESSTSQVEKLARQYGGWVVSSDLRSTPWKTTSSEISGDSILIVTEYEVSTQVVVRVPNCNYDSVLTQIGKMHIYLDFRTLRTEDVTSSFLRNKLKAESKTKYEKRINNAVDSKNNRLDDVVDAETNAASLADQAIENKVANFELQDRIDYSTITLNMYQAHQINKETTVNIRLDDYKPGFGHNIWSALVFGWDLLKYLVIGLVYLWSLLLLAVVTFFVIRFFIRRSSRKKNKQ